MKKLHVAMIAFGFAAGMVQADILVQDNFNYNGALTANGWSAYSGADASITANGSVATIGAGGEDIRRTFTDRLTNPTYALFTLRVSTLPATGGEYSFGFSDGTLMESRFGIVSQGGGTSFGLTTYGASTVVSNTLSGLSLNTDYSVTVYFDGVNNHRLWVNTDGSDFATPDLQTTGVNNGIDGFFIRQAGDLDAGASSWSMDDLVVATTFAEVVPEPATASLLLGGLLGLRMLRRKKA